MKDRLFPNGVTVFVFGAFLQWIFTQGLNSINSCYIGYIIIAGYTVYVGILIHIDQFKLFRMTQGFQWIILFIIPLSASMVSLAYLRLRKPKTGLLELMSDKDNSCFLSVVFFFFVLLIWTLLVVGKQLVDGRHFLAYAATCVPIKNTSNDDSMTVCLVKNNSHRKSAWMFPGGHVKMFRNTVNEKTTVLSDVSDTPEKVVLRKVTKEAGLKDIQLLSMDDKFRTGMRRLNTSWCLKSPALTYLFRVSEHANCRITQKHLVHFDFTYIGIYQAIKRSQYETFEFSFSPKSLPNGTDAAINEIDMQLRESLNRKMKNDPQLPSYELYPDSIPEMIFCAWKYHNIYNKL